MGCWYTLPAGGKPVGSYLTPQGYTEALEYLRQGPQCTVTNRLVGHRAGSPARVVQGAEPVTFELHGGYGPDLMTEVHPLQQAGRRHCRAGKF